MTQKNLPKILNNIYVERNCIYNVDKSLISGYFVTYNIHYNTQKENLFGVV